MNGTSGSKNPSDAATKAMNPVNRVKGNMSTQRPVMRQAAISARGIVIMITPALNARKSVLSPKMINPMIKMRNRKFIFLLFADFKCLYAGIVFRVSKNGR